MPLPTPKVEPKIEGKVSGSGLLRNTLIVAGALYAGLFASSCVPLLGMFIFIFAFYAFYFWAYIGAAVAIAVFLITCLISRRIFHRRRHRLQLAIQLSAIAFAIVGIWLMAMVPLVGHYYDLHMGGYRLHTRIWLDADAVRAWASKLDLSQDSAMSPSKWPLSLIAMAGLTEDVSVDEETRDVTIEHGSALTGHWGIHISARGTDWAGESSGHGGMGDTKEKLEDGVWLWSTMN